MHGVVGVWACLFVGLLAKQEYVTQAYGMSEPSEHYGAFYGAKGNLFAAQLVGVLSIIAWVLTLMTPLFYALKRLGLLRISPEEEHAGLDISKHGGSAYNGDLTGAGALGASKPERVPVSLTRE